MKYTALAHVAKAPRACGDGQQTGRQTDRQAGQAKAAALRRGRLAAGARRDGLAATVASVRSRFSASASYSASLCSAAAAPAEPGSCCSASSSSLLAAQAVFLPVVLALPRCAVRPPRLLPPGLSRPRALLGSCAALRRAGGSAPCWFLLVVSVTAPLLLLPPPAKPSAMASCTRASLSNCNCRALQVVPVLPLSGSSCLMMLTFLCSYRAGGVSKEQHTGIRLIGFLVVVCPCLTGSRLSQWDSRAMMNHPYGAFCFDADCKGCMHMLLVLLVLLLLLVRIWIS